MNYVQNVSNILMKQDKILMKCVFKERYFFSELEKYKNILIELVLHFFNWIKHPTPLLPFIVEIDILLVFYSWTSCHSFISGHVTQCIQILAICYWISSIISKLLKGSNVKTKTNSNFAVKVTERSNHSILLSIWWITFFRHLYDNGIRIT